MTRPGCRCGHCAAEAFARAELERGNPAPWNRLVAASGHDWMSYAYPVMGALSGLAILPAAEHASSDGEFVCILVSIAVMWAALGRRLVSKRRRRWAAE